MLKITFENGNEINISSSDIIAGFDNLPATDMNRTFYAVEGYSSFCDMDFESTTSDAKFAFTGFILSHECFSIDKNNERHIYMSSSVKSVSLQEH